MERQGRSSHPSAQFAARPTARSCVIEPLVLSLVIQRAHLGVVLKAQCVASTRWLKPAGNYCIVAQGLVVETRSRNSFTVSTAVLVATEQQPVAQPPPAAVREASDLYAHLSPSIEWEERIELDRGDRRTHRRLWRAAAMTLIIPLVGAFRNAVIALCMRSRYHFAPFDVTRTAFPDPAKLVANARARNARRSLAQVCGRIRCKRVQWDAAATAYGASRTLQN
jgi:hypothetical protein